MRKRYFLTQENACALFLKTRQDYRKVYFIDILLIV